MCPRPSEVLNRDWDETRDPCLRDRDVQNFVRDETFKIRDETLQLPRRWPRPSSSRDSSLGSFNVSPRRFPWRMGNTLTMKKICGLNNSHHGKLFPFVILWVFALYFENYHWIINGLHHKDYCNCTALDMSHHIHCNLQATKISKLQLII